LKEEMYFDETKDLYIVINHAFRNIKKVGFYKAIFTNAYDALSYEDKNMTIGVIMGDYGLSDFKELIDHCIAEKLDVKSPL
jgi:hypothetical protein